MSQQVYSIQGFLWKYKKGVTGGSWKKNWVYADNTVIAQYGGNQRPLPNEAPKYKWKIADCVIRASDLRRFSFEVSLEGAEGAIFAADDASSYDKWMKILVYDHQEKEREEERESREDVTRLSGEDLDDEVEGESKDAGELSHARRAEQLAKEFFKKNKLKKVSMSMSEVFDTCLIVYGVL